MSLTNVFISIIIMAIVTAFTRAFPFVFFGSLTSPPKIILFLGKFIPPVVMTILVLYCLQDIKLWDVPHGLNEIMAVILVVGLHRWKRNPLVSVFGATAFYMMLLQTDILRRLF